MSDEREYRWDDAATKATWQEAKEIAEQLNADGYAATYQTRGDGVHVLILTDNETGAAWRDETLPRLMFVDYTQGRPRSIDVALRDSNTWRGAYGGRTMEEMRDEYPGVELDTLAHYAETADSAWRTAPSEIDRERWYEMLEVLPPVGWTRDGNTESFKLSERTSGNITAVFARVGSHYYEMQDDITLTHAEIIQRVQAVA
jgi:hypothetical protein